MRVKDAIAQVDTLLQQLAQGISAASLVTILAGLLVLAGAIAAGARTRLYDATVLKVLGATRAQIALVYIAGIWRAGRRHRRHRAGGRHPGGRRDRARRSWTSLSSSTPRRRCVTVVGGGAATLLFGLFGALAALQRPAGRSGCANA